MARLSRPRKPFTIERFNPFIGQREPIMRFKTRAEAQAKLEKIKARWPEIDATISETFGTLYL